MRPLRPTCGQLATCSQRSSRQGSASPGCKEEKREVAPGLGHRSHKGLNDRAEYCHLPFRKRERTMQGYRSPGALQRFVSIHSAIRNSFSVPARRRNALAIRYHRMEAFDAWKSAADIA
ncbi:hypothetical protein [Poseidonocella sp. HB161398]|uniref:hypothetical protein n=1 Tax=Poseidonocella sp. HB161398 TaxID=2320855 RepID=UPI003514FC95